MFQGSGGFEVGARRPFEPPGLVAESRNAATRSLGPKGLGFRIQGLGFRL